MRQKLFLHFRILMGVLSGVVSISPVDGFAYDAEYRPLYRGGRSMAMGGAYVALADDEQAVFLNPAGLAGVRAPAFRYAALDTVVGSSLLSKSLSEMLELSSSLSGLSQDTLNLLIGKDIYAQAQYSPTLIAPHFGLGYLVDLQTGFMFRNSALPQLNFGFQTTHGVQMGTGFSVLGKRARKKWDLRFGVAGKLMWRRGGWEDFSFAEMVKLRTDILSTSAPGFGQAWGADLGMQAIRYIGKKWVLMSGAAFTNAGNLVFSGAEKVDNQLGNLSLGVAARYNLNSRVNLKLAYEANQLNFSNIDWRKRNHIGIELDTPVLSLMGGVNQVFLTYGLKLDFWIFNFMIYSYREELNALVNQYPQRRFGLNFNLKFEI